MQDDEKKDDGSVWTSYSDLFTTVAVIFLVMFVFALIKASVTKMQAVVQKKAHESELKGKVSSSAKKQTEKKIKIVNESLNEIGEYEDLINQKMKEMNKFVKKLKSSKTVMKDLIKDQRRKETLLNVVSNKLESLELKLKDEKTQSSKLEKEIKKKLEKISKIEQVSKKVKQEKEQLDIIVNEKKEALKVKELENKDLSQQLNKETQKLKQKIVQEEKIKLDLEKTVTNLKEREIVNDELSQKLTEQTRIKNETEKTLTQYIQDSAKEKNLLEKNIEQLKIDVSTKIEVIDQKKEVIKTNNREIASFTQEVKELSNWKESKTTELENTKNILDETVKVKNERQIEIDKLNQIKSKLQQNSHDLTAKLESEAQTTLGLNTELNKFRDQLKLQKNKNSDSLKKLANLSRELASEKQMGKTLEGKLQSSNSKVSQLDALSKKQASSISAANQKNQNTQQALELVKSNLGHLDGKFKQEQQKNGQLNLSNNNLNAKNEGLSQARRDLSKRLEELLKEIAALKKVNKSLGEENSKFISFKEELNGKMKNLQGQMHGLRGENARLLNNWNGLNDAKIAAENKLALLRKSKAELMKRLALLEGRMNDKSKLSESEAVALQKSLDELNDKNVFLKDTLRDFAQKVVDVKDKLRNNIAIRLAKEFRKANINVHVDEKTGNVVLLMNENFRFQKNSFKLNASARNTLRQIIPIYSEVLFGNEQVKQSIQAFNVVGHASPNYKGKYVEPLSHNNLAYSYNMRLSAQRAASITNFIFGKRMGKYHYKRFLKGYTSAIGRGYTEPVRKLKNLKNGRRPASTKSDKCGTFDCYASQRVELSFTLKDDVESLNKIINMAKSVK